jgi:hypothetical protein
MAPAHRWKIWKETRGAIVPVFPDESLQLVDAGVDNFSELQQPLSILPEGVKLEA